jgi:hypothetical protein
LTDNDNDNDGGSGGDAAELTSSSTDAPLFDTVVDSILFTFSVASRTLRFIANLYHMSHDIIP